MVNVLQTRDSLNLIATRVSHWFIERQFARLTGQERQGYRVRYERS